MSKKRFLFTAVLSLIASASVIGFTSCKKDNKTDVPEPQNYGESGVYYTEADGNEYFLSLADNKFSMSLDGKSGDYTYDGENFVVKAGDADITAAYSNGAVTVTYNGATYRFIRRVNYDVTFESDDGTAIAKKTVINGKTIEKPEDPEKTGYNFIGWYADAEYTTPYNFGSTPITGNTTIFARYAEKTGTSTEFTVSFEAGEGIAIADKTTIGGIVYDLPVVDKAGFDGWYVSDYGDPAKLTYKYTGQTLKSNVTMYAVYTGSVPQASVSATGVTWSATGVNSEYTVTITDPYGNAVSSTGSTTSYDYDFANKPAGEYVITIEYNKQTSTAYYNNKGLDKVSVFEVVEPSVLVYNAVENADKYYITVECGNENHSHEMIDNGKSLTYTFDSCEMKEGGIKFVVTAVASGYGTSVSDAYYFERKLDAVTGLYVNSADTAIWSAVKGATNYVVTVTSGNEEKTYDVGANTSFSLKDYTGAVSVSVKATAKGYVSAEAATAEYVKSSIAAPANLTITGNMLTWDEVEGASSYVVKVGNKTYTAASNSFDMTIAAGDVAGLGEYTASVQAIAADGSSDSQYGDAIKLTAVDAKDVLTYSNGKVYWQYAVGSNYYQVKIDGAITRVTEGNSYAVTLSKAGENEIAVRHNYGDNMYTPWSNISVYAYAVTYDVAGGKYVETQYKAVGDEITLPTTTKTGYDFNSWYTVPGGPATNGKVYNETVFGAASDIVLYAYYTPKKYALTFDFADGGAFADEPSEEETEVSYLGNYSLPVPVSSDPTKAFGGWYSEANARGYKYTDGLGNGVKAWEFAESRTLVAYWVDMFRYLENQDGETYAVMGAEGAKNATYVKIPATYNDKLVTIVEGGAFTGAANLTTVDIPDTVTNVEVTAFTNCNALTDVNIYKVATADLPVDESNNVYAYTPVYYSQDGVLFMNGENDEKILEFFPKARTGEYRIPVGTTTIPSTVFSSAKFETVYIPGTVKKIEFRAFYYCSALNKVIFESASERVNLTVAEQAFSSCSNLESITLPDRITDFKSTMFAGCTKLAKVNVDGDEGDYISQDDGVVFTKDKTELVYAPLNYMPGNGVYTIPAGTSKIRASAFKDCKNITKVVIPGYVADIGDEAFYHCYGLTEIEFQGKTPAANLTIGTNAFYNVSKLAEVVLPENLVTMKTGAFANNAYLKKITVNSVGEVNFDNGVTSAGNTLDKLTIGKNVGVMEINGIFGSKINVIELDPENPNYKSVDGVLFDAGVTTIIYFPSGKTGEYVLPSTVTTIGAAAFREKNISKITIGKSVATINENAFADCTELQEVVFEETPSGETAVDLEILAYAFANSAVSSVTLPERLVKIDEYVFKDTKLFTIDIPAKTVSMGDVNDSGDITVFNVFDSCYGLYKITVAEGNEKFATKDGVLYAKNTDGDYKTLIMAPAGIVPDGVTMPTEVTVPSTVTKIFDKAFAANKSVEKVTFSSTDEITVGTEVFYGASSLAEVTLSEGFSAIGDSMFYNCSAIERIEIPHTVKTIGKAAFYGCYSLENVEFTGERTAEETLELADCTYVYTEGTRITGTGAPGVFADCVKLKNIVFPEGTTKIGAYAFATAYLATTAYNEAENKEGLDLGLESVTIPGTVKTIGNYAFQGKAVAQKSSSGGMTLGVAGGLVSEVKETISALKTVTFTTKSDGTYDLEEIGNYAFAYTDLTSIDIPKSVKKIGERAFFGALGLEEVTFGTYTKDGEGKVTASDSVLEEIGVNSFSCTGIQGSFAIPSTVKTIKAQAFARSTGITEINFLKNSVGKTSLGMEIASSSGGGSGSGGGGRFSVTARDPGLGGGGGTGGGTTSGTIPKAFCKWAFAYTSITDFEFPLTMATGGTYEVETNLFQGCTELTEVNITTAITSIESVFAGCNSITSVTVDTANMNFSDKMEGLEGNGILYNKTTSGITAIRYAYGDLGESFVIPEGITEIGTRAFEGQRFKSVTIPAGVTTIGDYAFTECKNLETVTFVPENTMTSLGKYLFQNCTALKNVTLPANITSIGNYCFYGCTSLEAISLREGITELGANAFGASGLKSVEIPASLKKLGEYAYQIGSSAATAVYSGRAFYKCESLSRVVFKGNIELIGCETFFGCTALKNIDIPDSVKCISYGAFQGSGLTSVSLPDGVVLGNKQNSSTATNATNNAPFAGASSSSSAKVFAECKDLKKVTFRGELPYLSGWTFRECVSLSTIESVQEDGSVLVNVLPRGMTMIGGYSFYNTAITEIAWNSTIDSKNGYGTYAFANCPNLTTVIMSGDTAKLPYQFFINSTNLVNVGYFDEEGNVVEHALPDTCTNIGVEAFRNCTSLEYLAIPDTVTTLYDRAFWGCTNFKANNGEFVVPSSIKALTKGVLYGCDSIERVVLHTGMNQVAFSEAYVMANGIPQYVNSSTYSTTDTVFPLAGMGGLTEIVIPNNLPYIVDENGFLFNGDILLLGLGGLVKGEVELPEYTGSVSWSAFSGNKALTNVYFNDKLTRIGRYAFYGCEALEADLVLPDSVQDIENYAFAYSGIKSVNIPNGARPGTYLFAGCPNIENVYYESPEYLNNNMFYESGLKTFTYKPAPSTATGKDYLPFKSASIPADFFRGCTELTSVIIESGTLCIEPRAFWGCTSISKIVIPKSVQYIAANAFHDWTADQVICFEADEFHAPKRSVWYESTCNAQIVYDYVEE